jgi:TolB-like protein/Tfp pilus assembly protein PilF
VIYQFNQFTVDSERYLLMQMDKSISIDPLVFNLLVYLIENSDRVVTRIELLDKLWQGKVVTDAALATRLKDARKAVLDSGAKQAVIKTHHGRGYQFIAELGEASTNDSQAIMTRSTTAQEALSLPDKPSIAVLPFTNMSGDAEQEAFIDGMTDEIITGLSRVPGLFVIANNSTMLYKGRAVDIKEVGREQGVRYVLEGGFRKVGNHIRVTAQLIDAISGLHIWAGRYQRELNDIFAVQDEITQKVVVELQVKLVTGEHGRLWSTGTKSVYAWELMIRARSMMMTFTRDDNQVARQLLEQALALDGSYSAAWSGLGHAYWKESIWKWCSDPEDSMRKALENANKALSIDACNPDAYALLGHIYMVRGDSGQAIAMMEKALDLAPGDSRMVAFLGNVLIDSGRIKEGIQKMLRAIRLCPFPLDWYLLVLGAGCHLDGDNIVAVTTLEQAVERMPESVLPRLWLASALAESGQVDDASLVYRSILDIEPDFSVVNWAESFKSATHAKLKVNLLVAGFLD